MGMENEGGGERVQEFGMLAFDRWALAQSPPEVQEAQKQQCKGPMG